MKASAPAALAIGIAVLAQGGAAQQMPASPDPHQVFRSPVLTSVGTARDLAFGDVSGDGKADAIVARPAGGTLHLGLGAGAFAAGVPAAAATGLVAVELPDLDGDGLHDLVGVRLGLNGFVRVALADGAGGFGAPADLPIAVESFFEYTSLVIGDADADGDPDVAVAVPPEFLPDSYYALYLNDGAGALTEHVITSVAKLARIVPVEVNGDGLPDVLVSHWAEVGPVAHHVVMAGQPGGGFAAGQTFQTDYVIDHVADLDQDGKADLLLGKNGGLVTWKGQGDGTFQPLEDVTLGMNVLAIDTADFDGDSNLDVVAFRNVLGDTLLLFGAGDGTLSTVTGVSMTPNGNINMTRPRLVDLDGDGGLDLATGYGIEGFGDPNPTLAAVRNVTYPAGGPLTDWGGARRGSGGYPVQIVTGTLVADSPVLFELEMARPNASAWMIIGFDAIFLPIKGGVLVPQPDLVIGPLPTGATGTVDIGGLWPVGQPTGMTFDVHFWIKDFGGLQGFAASGSAHLVQP